MGSRLHIFLALAVFSLTAAQSANRQVQKGVIEDTEALINILKQFVQIEIPETRLQIQNVVQEIKYISEDTVNEYKLQITQEHEKLLDKIEQIQHDLGASAEPCIEATMPIVEALVFEMEMDFIICKGQKVQEAFDIINSLIVQIGYVPQSVNQLENEFYACDISDVSCFLEISAKATNLLMSIPQSLAAYVKEARELVAKNANDVENCGLNQMTQMNKEVAVILKDIVDCVLGKQLNRS